MDSGKHKVKWKKRKDKKKMNMGKCKSWILFAEQGKTEVKGEKISAPGWEH
jgi:hypothetical protein